LICPIIFYQQNKKLFTMATLYNKTALKKIRKKELVQMFLDKQAREINYSMEDEIEELKNDLRLCAEGLIPHGMVGGIVECEREKRHKAEEENKKLKEQLDEQYSFSYFKQVKELTAENEKLKEENKTQENKQKQGHKITQEQIKSAEIRTMLEDMTGVGEIVECEREKRHKAEEENKKLKEQLERERGFALQAIITRGKDFQPEIDDLKEENEALKEENEELKEELEEKEEEVLLLALPRLEEENKKLKEENEKLKEELDEWETEYCPKPGEVLVIENSDEDDYEYGCSVCGCDDDDHPMEGDPQGYGDAYTCTDGDGVCGNVICDVCFVAGMRVCPQCE
jgi:chromosome segregation ATPase